MLKRLLFGLFLGLVVGAALAAALVKGMSLALFTPGAGGAALAYLFAAVTGVVVGLVAGKPIWASGGQIEAALKAFFGALIAAGGMYALRRFLTADVDLGAIGAGRGAMGDLPAVTLPILGAVLGAFYEADNTPEPKDKEGAGGKAAPAPGSKVRVSAADELDEDEPAEEKKKERR